MANGTVKVPLDEFKVRYLKIQLREKVKDGKSSVSYDLYDIYLL